MVHLNQAIQQIKWLNPITDFETKFAVVTAKLSCTAGGAGAQQKQLADEREAFIFVRALDYKTVSPVLFTKFLAPNSTAAESPAADNTVYYDPDLDKDASGLRKLFTAGGDFGKTDTPGNVGTGTGR